MLDALVEQCKVFIHTKTTEQNVCSILSDCIIYKEEELMNKCVDFVDKNSVNVIKSEHFLDISKEGLRVLVKSDIIGKVQEVDLFKASVMWAKCQGGNGKKKYAIRNILGDLRYDIRYLRMSAKEISDITEESPDILTLDEQMALIRCVLQPTQSRTEAVQSMGFNIKERIDKGKEFTVVCDTFILFMTCQLVIMLRSLEFRISHVHNL